jgi:hypothetical protein
LYSRYYDFILDVNRRVLFKKKCVCDIGEIEESMEVECTFIIAMENG